MRKLTKTAAVVASMAVMAMGAVASVSADELRNTWSQENGTWYYYNENGRKVSNQWAIDSAGDWYFLGDDSKIVTNEFIRDRQVVDIDELNDSDDMVYFVDGNGKMVTGWKEIDINLTSHRETATPKDSKNWFYFSTTGRMYSEEWVNSNNKWYYMGTDGKMYNKYLGDVDGETYYFTKNGDMITGWYKVTTDDVKMNGFDALGGTLDGNIAVGDYVYTDENGVFAHNEWKKIDGNWYYFENYTMLSDTFQLIEKDWYYFKSSGAMATGSFTVKDDSNNKNKYFSGSNGVLKMNDFVTSSGKYYYAKSTGILEDEGYLVAFRYAAKGENGKRDEQKTGYAYVSDYTSATQLLLDVKAITKIDELNQKLYNNINGNGGGVISNNKVVTGGAITSNLSNGDEIKVLGVYQLGSSTYKKN